MLDACLAKRGKQLDPRSEQTHPIIPINTLRGGVPLQKWRTPTKKEHTPHRNHPGVPIACQVLGNLSYSHSRSPSKKKGHSYSLLSTRKPSIVRLISTPRVHALPGSLDLSSELRTKESPLQRLTRVCEIPTQTILSLIFG